MAVHKQGYRLPRAFALQRWDCWRFWRSSGRADAADKNAVLVVDANTGQTLYQSSADAPRHPASLAKMMTLYIVFEQIEQGRLSYQTRIKVSANAAAAAPSKLELDEGDEIAVIDAIKALITKSANDVAVAVAEHIGGTEANFARLMTQKAAQLGMKSTLFKNASGLPNDEQVTTARDMVTLALRLQDDFPKHYPLFATRTFDVQRRHLQEPQQPARQLRGHGRPEDRLHPRLGVQPGRLGPPRPEARDRRRVRRHQRLDARPHHAHVPQHRPGQGLARQDARAGACPGRRPSQAGAGAQGRRRAEPAARGAPAGSQAGDAPAADEPPQAQTSTQPIEVARVRTVLVTPPRPADKAPDSIEAVLEKPEARLPSSG